MNGLHVVIKGELYQYGLEWFSDISGCAAIEHKFGLVQKERPHYHIWLPSSYSVSNTKKALREFYDTKQEGLKWNTHANAYYTVKEHGDFDKWLNYAWSKDECKEPSVGIWNVGCEKPLPKPTPINELVYAKASDVPESKPIPAKRKKEPTKMEQFYLYCKSYFDEFPMKDISRDEILKLLLSWSKGGMNKFRVYEFVHYATYRLLAEGGEKTSKAFESFESRILDEWSRMF